ncbi:nuclear transport factor 2 family protein [Candidatus Mycobacterium wuenschmannii]|uniref:Nuclear transport factor 2 family protein n=1 Tax=Candidatus Mycobacterium wuenschmannii TaxID=3027808 RepID=A0ABY8W4X3_9MYCO|nr:nuclear transport factor 2 family protein [Candidatus Mycobacterium wuenschmannii]WIM88824.1 nuclear transport factor 2 family protein [Candidatus Mycobacterium wuenschmannii]
MAVEDRLEALERRLRSVEDELAIRRLLASYGPLVDAGDGDTVAALWTEDGQYDVDGWVMRGRSDVAAMVQSSGHQSMISAGAAHFLGPVCLRVDGDNAIAVCESIVVRHDDEGRGYRVWRAGANHVTLRRTDEGWRIVRRTTRALDGSSDARNVLAAGATGRPL